MTMETVISRGSRGRRGQLILVAATIVLFALTGCSVLAEPPNSGPSPAQSDPTFGMLGQAGCKPASPADGDEIMATPNEAGASAYAQFQGASPRSLRADRSTVKEVLRVTGSGDLTLELTGPDGKGRHLDWGPEPHTTSNYNRPGDEWGIGTSFDRSGCWSLSAIRGGAVIATYWLDVQ
ncbi:hypothetical protein [uncultured Amnibacterium sp.]|uniref:hypothetical protein n=1 Tax=uncultured Amnibacterium sp. TaxID=1631851 RepID=UPI0035CB49B8